MSLRCFFRQRSAVTGRRSDYLLEANRLIAEKECRRRPEGEKSRMRRGVLGHIVSSYRSHPCGEHTAQT